MEVFTAAEANVLRGAARILQSKQDYEYLKQFEDRFDAGMLSEAAHRADDGIFDVMNLAQARFGCEVSNKATESWYTHEHA